MRTKDKTTDSEIEGANEAMRSVSENVEICLSRGRFLWQGDNELYQRSVKKTKKPVRQTADNANQDAVKDTNCNNTQ